MARESSGLSVPQRITANAAAARTLLILMMKDARSVCGSVKVRARARRRATASTTAPVTIASRRATPTRRATANACTDSTAPDRVTSAPMHARPKAA